MYQIDWNTGLILLGLTAIVLELILGVATGFDLLLIGLFLIAGGIVGQFFSSVPLALATSAILSFIYVFVGRSFIKEKLHIQTRATNVESLINKTAMVTKAIEKDKAGQVKVEGEIWRAEANKDIAQDQTVTVRSVSGVTLHVE